MFSHQGFRRHTLKAQFPRWMKNITNGEVWEVDKGFTEAVPRVVYYY